MIIKEETTQIGYIQKPHGVKGELALALTEGIYANNFDPEFILLAIDNGLVPFYVESYRVKSNKNMLVKLETVETEYKAKDLAGSQVFLENSLLDEAEDLPSEALVGFNVNDRNKGFIGKITEVQEISNNPLFVIDFEGKEILIPINPDFIIDISESDKTIEVSLPEGLVDLYLSDSSDDEDDDDFII